tara:strand:- start:408 stop:818 length:411 start_codon:yes stop_codon:yes gene_type:complete
MSNNTIKRQLRAVNELIDYYEKDPVGRRGITADGTCCYRTPEGKSCAVGRAMNKKGYAEYRGNTSLTVEGIYKFHDENPDDLFQVKYKGLGRDFWVKMQTIHDGGWNWDLEENTISEQGEKRVKSLIFEIERGEYA